MEIGATGDHSSGSHAGTFPRPNQPGHGRLGDVEMAGLRGEVARLTGVGRAIATYEAPIEGRDEWVAAVRRLA